MCNNNYGQEYTTDRIELTPFAVAPIAHAQLTGPVKAANIRAACRQLDEVVDFRRR